MACALALACMRGRLCEGAHPDRADVHLGLLPNLLQIQLVFAERHDSVLSQCSDLLVDLCRHVSAVVLW